VPLSIWGKSFPLFLLRRIGDAVRAAGSGGSVFHNLSKSGFEAISVLLTSYELAQKFEEMVEPLIARIEANQQQQENLAATRDALLPRLISGQMQLDSMEAVDGC
jgi:type I restriction enzyme S subunit